LREGELFSWTGKVGGTGKDETPLEDREYQQSCSTTAIARPEHCKVLSHLHDGCPKVHSLWSDGRVQELRYTGLGSFGSLRSLRSGRLHATLGEANVGIDILAEHGLAEGRLRRAHAESCGHCEGIEVVLNASTSNLTVVLWLLVDRR
jgi:hypothetical protein